ncbi:MAG TPA: hypothetical protein VG937_16205 [Polyangiaceae bacterium]|nr:hypothetical protein [Polyangiaceae bacterium]
MSREAVHRCWAPADGLWSPWVKPALFASIEEDLEPRPMAEAEAWLQRELVEPLDRSGGDLSDVVLVIDLPGDAGVWVGAGLVKFGFRPIPLYNAVQWEASVVNLRPVVCALVDAAEQVARAKLSAPPAFLLDAHRMSGAHLLRPGAFDNRSFCNLSDFPSLDTLRARGVRRAVLVQEEPGRAAPDLEPILLRWQRGGIDLWRKFSDDSEPAAPFVLRPRALPLRFAHAVRRALLRRAASGAYGTFVPMPSAG